MSAITVIGLFSAIIMSFFGGISFSQQALEALRMASPVRLVFILALIGFVLANVLFSILYMIGKLTGKKVCGRCFKANKDSLACECEKPSFWCKLVNKYPYMLWINAFLVSLMGITSSIWVSTLFYNRAFNKIVIISIIGVWILLLLLLMIIAYKKATYKAKTKAKK